jgi:uncharacterized protein (TIGR03435 family)
MKRLLLATLPASALSAAAILLMPPLLAQAPALPAAGPTFEVASVKRNTSSATMIMATVGMLPGGRVDFRNLTLRNLMVRAYGVQPHQVVGGPGWVDTDRFDVVAKAEGDASPAEVNLMLRALLAERFKLAVHTETRDLPMYRLVVARRDGRLGSDLQPSTTDCSPGARGAAPPAAPGGQDPVVRGGGPGFEGVGAGRGGPGSAPGGPMGCRTLIGPGRIMMGGQPIAQFAQLLSNQVGRPVIDDTGLDGRYDIVLSFAPEGRGGGFGGPRSPDAPPVPVDPDAPSLFTAMQEQLGLRLESGRGPVEVIVIDSVEPPTED